MTHRFLALGLIALLASCGVDGKPVAPAAKTGLSISGTLKAGVAK